MEIQPYAETRAVTLNMSFCCGRIHRRRPLETEAARAEQEIRLAKLPERDQLV